MYVCVYIYTWYACTLFLYIHIIYLYIYIEPHTHKSPPKKCGLQGWMLRGSPQWVPQQLFIGSKKIGYPKFWTGADHDVFQ